MLPPFVVALLLVLSTCCLSASCSVSFNGDRVISITVNSDSHAQWIMYGMIPKFDLDLWISKRGQIDVRVPADKWNEVQIALNERNFSFKIVHDDLQKLIDFETVHHRASRYLGINNFFDAYASYGQMMEYLKDLQGNFTSLSTLVQIGQTLQNRSITGIKITSNPSTSKPAIVLIGTQHAREWISPMTVAFLAQSLLTNYTTDPVVKSLVDNFEWIIVPIVNADGYNYSWTTNRMWRKNRRDDGACYGVDNNRNWDFEWDTVGASNSPCSDEYAGKNGFSEPEETSVANYISNHGAVQGFVDFHSYGELWMQPWGYTKQLTPDNSVQETCGTQIVQAINKVNRQNFKNGPVYTTIYPASGGSNDWTYGVPDAVYSFACELRGNSFVIPPTNIIPSGLEIFAGIKVMGQYMMSNPRPPKVNN